MTKAPVIRLRFAAVDIRQILLSVAGDSPLIWAVGTGVYVTAPDAAKPLRSYASGMNPAIHADWQATQQALFGEVRFAEMLPRSVVLQVMREFPRADVLIVEVHAQEVLLSVASPPKRVGRHSANGRTPKDITHG